MVLGPTLTLVFTLLTVVVNDWEVLSGGEPLSVTITVNDAVAGPAGGVYEKTPVVGLIVAPAAAPGPRLVKLPGIWRGFFDDKWHGGRSYDRHRRHNTRVHNIMTVIGRGRRGPTPRRIAPTAIGCSGNVRRVMVKPTNAGVRASRPDTESVFVPA